MRGLLLAVALVACAPAKPPTTSLRLRLAPTEDAPKNARVTVDDQAIGSLAFVTKRGVALPPGKHRLTIEADGYLPWDGEVDAGEKGGLINVDVRLVKKPD